MVFEEVKNLTHDQAAYETTTIAPLRLQSQQTGYFNSLGNQEINKNNGWGQQQ
jgi:hypothetical protein